MAVLIDSHVHIYSVSSVQKILDYALTNFSHAARDYTDSQSVDFVIFLTENIGIDVYKELYDKCTGDGYLLSDSGNIEEKSWLISRAEDKAGLVARQGENGQVFLLPGRQLISKENLELLSLGAATNIPDKSKSVIELANKVWADGGIPVLPWGVGKWTGQRMQKVQEFLAVSGSFPKVIGDNGNRPFFWPLPGFLSGKNVSTYLMISGSDPLPLFGRERKIGLFGSLIQNRSVNPLCPSESVKSMILEPQAATPYGPQVGLFQFLGDQLLVNLKKRFSLFFK